MTTKPTRKVLADHLTRAGIPTKHVKTWAAFLHGLDWDTVKPLTQIALNAGVHPALAAGVVARETQNETIRDILITHLEAKRADDLTPEAEQATGPHCPDCQCCLASECTDRACDTNGTGTQWCPCAGTPEEQPPESKGPTTQEGTPA